jgi:GxxExxY protein
VEIPIIYYELLFDVGFRLNLFVEDLVIAELKAVEIVNPVWEVQIISHLTLTKMRLGYLINFNVPLIKQGIKRFVK